MSNSTLIPAVPERILEPLRPLPGAHSALLATNQILASGVVGITSQFREGATVYDERYFESKSKVLVIKKALDVIGAKPHGPITALDIGCGSGNATFGLLQMFDEAHVFATDLSPELLAILVQRSQHLGKLDHITPFVADASTLRLSASSFDLIVGSSMVHHLIDAEGFMTHMVQSVREGGAAMFFEPFQAGHVMLRQLLSTLVRLSDVNAGLSENRVQFFRDYIFTINTMIRDDRDDPVFGTLDDKWMFTRALFQRVAERTNTRVEVFPTNPAAFAFRDKITDLLYQGLGEKDPLPPWAAEIVDEADEGITLDLRNELLLEGCIVFGR